MVDRPLDCSECKRELAVQYSELVGGKVVRTVMCESCPHLERQLLGSVGGSESGPVVEAGLACGGCGTSLEAIRMGHALGCGECYHVFGDVIVDELIRDRLISRHFSGSARNSPLHMGRSPGEVTEISPTLRLIALNEALDETLVREDYEGAALLRDQIEKLKTKGAEGDGKEGA